ncbi:MAG TPA: ABC transporter permease subunit [Firmicutes bacterium]|nr:ABC transporter permease subunit [Bacillota bacterium]
MRRSLIIASRELREVLSDTRFVYTIMVTGLVLPVFYAYVGLGAIRTVPSGVASALFPMWFLLSSILPATFSMQLAIASLVGEKENRTIEPLVATPVSNLEIFVGKVVGSLVPPLALVAIVQVIFLLASYIFARIRYGMPFSPDMGVILRTALLVPFIILTMVSIAVMISSRATSVRSAQQMGAFINLPVILLLAYKGPQLLDFLGRSPFEAIVVMLAANTFLLRIGARLFDRERILTQIG